MSGAAHAALAVFGRIDLPAPPEASLPLAARIVSAPPAAPAAAQEARAVARPSASRRPRLVARSDPGTSWTRPADRSEWLSTPQDEPMTEESSAAAAASDEPAAANEPVTVATAPSSTYAPEAPALRSLPKSGRITYNLIYGREGFPVGRTVQTWEMDGGRYRLASRSETVGLVDLFRSENRTYVSLGSLTSEGLKPATFHSTRNRGRGPEEARSHFDWDGSTVSLESATAQRYEKLPPRSQDLLSFTYQLSLDPPQPGRLRQFVTNGSKLEMYELDVMPEETIETPLGALRTVRLKQRVRPGEERIELWLAAEYRYLPVRLRFFNREGEPTGEQIVTEIRLSND